MTTTDPLTEAARTAVRLGLDAQDAMLGVAQQRIRSALADLPIGAGALWQGRAAGLFTIDAHRGRGALDAAGTAIENARRSTGATRRWLDE